MRDFDPSEGNIQEFCILQSLEPEIGLRKLETSFCEGVLTARMLVLMGSQHCRFFALCHFSVTWGESEKQSSWLGALPAAEEAAGDCFLELHPEHVSARCSELHAIRVKVVDFTAELRASRVSDVRLGNLSRGEPQVIL